MSRYHAGSRVSIAVGSDPPRVGQSELERIATQGQMICEAGGRAEGSSPDDERDVSPDAVRAVLLSLKIEAAVHRRGR